MKVSVMCFVLCLTGAAAAVGQPAITSVENGGSYLTGIAPGSIFVVKGTGLGPAKLLQASSLPYQSTLSQTSISFTPAAGGSAIPALMVYVWDKQDAALLPSSAAPGDYNVTVTYNGAPSAAFATTVVARNFGFVTQASNGAGPAQATYGGYDLNRFTTSTLAYAGHNWALRPAKTGDTIVLWGTGLGADPQSDTSGGSSGDQTAAASVKVVVGGVTVTPGYAGRSGGTPGLDQINFTLPASVTAGCFVNVQVKGSGFTSNLGSIAVTQSGQSACSNPGLSTAQLAKLDAGQQLTVGVLGVSKIATTTTALGQTISMQTESASGAFIRYTVDSVSTAGFALQQNGACYVYKLSGTTTQISQGTGTSTPLDAGPQLTLNGPNANNIALKPLTSEKFYDASLYSSGFPNPLGGGNIGGTGSPTIVQGTYTISGPGGADVGKFTASTDVPGDFTWTNESSISDPIARGSDLPITWTGGGSGMVTMTGTGYSQTGGTGADATYDATTFICTAQATAGSFTIPTSVLQQVPVVSSDPTSGSFGSLAVFATPNPNTSSFTAPLTAGGSIDFGYFYYDIGASKNTGYN